MPRRPKRHFPNIVEVLDPRSGRHAGWRAQAWVTGVLKRGALRKTQEEAHEDAKGILDLRKRVDDDDPDPTLKVAMDRVRAALTLKRRRAATAYWFEQQFRVLKREWPESTRLREIGRKSIHTWIEKRLRTVSPNTVHHHLRALRRVFLVSGLPSPTADKRLLVPDTVPAPTRSTSWPGVCSLLARIQKADPRAWGLVGLAAYTGIRRSELARVRIDDVDLDEEALHVRHPKVAKRPRVLPMPEGLVTLAAHAMQGHARDVEFRAWLVPGKTENNRVEHLIRISKKWKFGWHLLRHTFATEMTRRRVPVNVLARLMGHTMRGQTMDYVHEEMPELREAMQKLWEKPDENRKRRKGDK